MPSDRLTRNDIEHISMILLSRYLIRLLIFIVRFEEAHGCTVNIARQKGDSSTRSLSKILKFQNESIPFSLFKL